MNSFHAPSRWFGKFLTVFKLFVLYGGFVSGGAQALAQQSAPLEPSQEEVFEEQPAPDASVQEAWSVLFSHGALKLSRFQACEPFEGYYEPITKPRTLAEDLAKVMAHVSQPPGQMFARAHCEPTDKRDRRFCTAHLTFNRGELVWSRIYLFQYRKGGSISSLQCVVVP